MIDILSPAKTEVVDIFESWTGALWQESLSSYPCTVAHLLELDFADKVELYGNMFMLFLDEDECLTNQQKHHVIKALEQRMEQLNHRSLV